ncbi:MAG TPA: GspMb/PilO family protein [Thiobacillaceae bacterium]|nr:GspMb/PilO family protein [Thiobacillaceae bacterium]
MADVINRLRWEATRILRRLGIAGALAMLVALAFVGLFLNNQSLQQEQDNLQTQVDDWKPAPRTAAMPGAESPLPGAMAQRKEIPQWLAQLQDAASEHDLYVPGIQYQPETTKGYFQYRIKLTLTGAYPQVRGFLNQILGTIPGLTLDRLRIGREEIGMQDVDATMQLSLYVQGGS